MPATNTAAIETDFVITRTFNAPRALVWKAFTEPERMEQWWGAPGLTTRVLRLELQPGGVFAYSQRTPEGNEMYGKWVYHEIAAPRRMVTVVSFTDAAGNAIRNPFQPNWPLEMFSIATFTEHQGKTTLTVTAAPHNASALECQTFGAGRESMKNGFGGTFDRLDEYLATIQNSARHLPAQER